MSVVALGFFIYNITRAFSGKNERPRYTARRAIRYSSSSFILGAYVFKFPEPVTEFGLLAQGLHFDVCAVIFFVVVFVSYMLRTILRIFKRTFFHRRAKQIKSKAVVYLEFL
jgi:hypothetical protein